MSIRPSRRKLPFPLASISTVFGGHLADLHDHVLVHPGLNDLDSDLPRTGRCEFRETLRPYGGQGEGNLHFFGHGHETVRARRRRGEHRRRRLGDFDVPFTEHQRRRNHRVRFDGPGLDGDPDRTGEIVEFITLGDSREAVDPNRKMVHAGSSRPVEFGVHRHRNRRVPARSSAAPGHAHHVGNQGVPGITVYPVEHFLPASAVEAPGPGVETRIEVEPREWMVGLVEPEIPGHAVAIWGPAPAVDLDAHLELDAGRCGEASTVLTAFDPFPRFGIRVGEAQLRDKIGCGAALSGCRNRCRGRRQTDQHRD